MSAKKSKKAVPTPLHLLQQLSQSLLEHLDNACTQALADAEKLLAKLEKQRGKAQDKLHDAHSKLQLATAAGKAKAQSKARKVIDELEGMLSALESRQAETRVYIIQLKKDAQQSLKLAQGVEKVKDAADKALDARTAVPAEKPASKPVVGRVVKPAAKPAQPRTRAAAKPAAAKTAAKPAAASPAVKPVASKPAAKPTAKPASKAAVAPAKAVSTATPARPAVKRVVKPAAKPAAAKPAAPATAASVAPTAPGDTL